MAMTLRLPAELDAELRAAAEEDHRSVQQAVVHAIETYLALRETVQIKSDPDTLGLLPSQLRTIAPTEAAEQASATSATGDADRAPHSMSSHRTIAVEDQGPRLDDAAASAGRARHGATLER